MCEQEGLCFHQDGGETEDATDGHGSFGVFISQGHRPVLPEFRVRPFGHAVV